jgi:hypothetical protein
MKPSDFRPERDTTPGICRLTATLSHNENLPYIRKERRVNRDFPYPFKKMLLDEKGLKLRGEK